MLERIKNASLDELTQMAQTLRARIIEVVSDNGGHLAPSLGVVELTLALPRWIKGTNVGYFRGDCACVVCGKWKTQRSTNNHVELHSST